MALIPSPLRPTPSRYAKVKVSKLSLYCANLIQRQLSSLIHDFYTPTGTLR